MIDDLRIVHALLRKYGPKKDAAWFGRLITVAQSDPEQFWARFNCDEIWGGSGSIADQFLVPNEEEPAGTKEDRRQYYLAMARLAHAMADAGIVNRRAKFIARAFTEWAADATDTGARP